MKISKKSKLTKKQRAEVFNVFDSVSELLRKKDIRYAQRYSEPRNCGFGYRCKFYFATNIEQRHLSQIKKVLPEGYTAEIQRSGYWPDLIIRTPIFQKTK